MQRRSRCARVRVPTPVVGSSRRKFEIRHRVVDPAQPLDHADLELAVVGDVEEARARAERGVGPGPSEIDARGGLDALRRQQAVEAALGPAALAGGSVRAPPPAPLASGRAQIASDARSARRGDDDGEALEWYAKRRDGVRGSSSRRHVSLSATSPAPRTAGTTHRSVCGVTFWQGTLRWPNAA
jgi:hypothetical protein